MSSALSWSMVACRAFMRPLVRIRQTPHVADVSSCGGEFGGEGGLFIEQLTPLKAVIELTEHAIEQVPKGGRVPVTVLVATSAIAGLGPG